MLRDKTTPFFVAALVATLGAAGCASAPEPVRLTISQVAAHPAQPWPPPPSRQIAATKSSVAALPARSVASHLDPRQVAEALERLGAEQRDELANLTDRLYQAKLELLQVSRSEDVANANDGYAKAREKVWDAISAAFQSQATSIGKDRVLLASLVGFPDPDPRSKAKAKKSDLEGQAINAKATTIRQSIGAKEDAFWMEVEALSSPARGAYVDKLRQIAAKYASEADKALSDARAEAADVLSGASSEIEAPQVDFGVFVPATPERSVELSAMNVTSSATIPQRARPAKPPAVDVFLRLKNYRLAAPGQKGRDVTQEFTAWNSKYSGAP